MLSYNDNMKTNKKGIATKTLYVQVGTVFTAGFKS